MISKEQMVPIYNTLLQIPVSGMGAIMMGECLKALQGLLMQEEGATMVDEKESD